MAEIPDLSVVMPPLEHATPEQVAELEADRDLGLAMLAGYALAYPNDFAEWELVGGSEGVERPFLVHTDDPAGGVSFDRVGVLDLLLRHRSNRTLWIWDHKAITPGRWPDFERTLVLDDQVSGYYDAVYRLLGERPSGFVLNALLKHCPSAPRIVRAQSKANRCPCGRDLLHDKDGKPVPHMISRDKGQTTTAALYRAEIKAHGLHESAFAEVLAAFDGAPRSYYERRVVTRTPERIEEWHLDTLDTAKQIATARPSRTVSSMHCPRCEFLSICELDTPEARQNFRVAERRFEEVDEAGGPEVKDPVNTLSYSRVACWRECHKKHWFRYDQCLRPLTEARALKFGKGIHLALAQAWIHQDYDAMAPAWLAWWQRDFKRLTGAEHEPSAKIALPF